MGDIVSKYLGAGVVTVAWAVIGMYLVDSGYEWAEWLVVPGVLWLSSFIFGVAVLLPIVYLVVVLLGVVK